MTLYIIYIVSLESRGKAISCHQKAALCNTVNGGTTQTRPYSTVSTATSDNSNDVMSHTRSRFAGAAGI